MWRIVKWAKVPLYPFSILFTQRCHKIHAAVVSFGITAATALAAWWKNNSFTGAALMDDGVMHDLHKLKCTGAECACVTIESKAKGVG